jgi:hypothetical protein
MEKSLEAPLSADRASGRTGRATGKHPRVQSGRPGANEPTRERGTVATGKSERARTTVNAATREGGCGDVAPRDSGTTRRRREVDRNGTHRLDRSAVPRSCRRGARLRRAGARREEAPHGAHGESRATPTEPKRAEPHDRRQLQKAGNPRRSKPPRSFKRRGRNADGQGARAVWQTPSRTVRKGARALARNRGVDSEGDVDGGAIFGQPHERQRCHAGQTRQRGWWRGRQHGTQEWYPHFPVSTGEEAGRPRGRRGTEKAISQSAPVPVRSSKVPAQVRSMYAGEQLASLHRPNHRPKTTEGRDGERPGSRHAGTDAASARDPKGERRACTRSGSLLDTMIRRRVEWIEPGPVGRTNPILVRSARGSAQADPVPRIVTMTSFPGMSSAEMRSTHRLLFGDVAAEFLK